jgi:hypothetical protein
MFSFIQDVPSNAEMYSKVRAGVGPETPQGLVAHIVIETATGLRYVDVWEDESSWTAFRDTRLFPVVHEVLASYGIEADPAQAVREPINVIDAWTAETVSAR